MEPLYRLGEQWRVRCSELAVLWHLGGKYAIIINASIILKMFDKIYLQIQLVINGCCGCYRTRLITRTIINLGKPSKARPKNMKKSQSTCDNFITQSWPNSLNVYALSSLVLISL